MAGRWLKTGAAMLVAAAGALCLAAAAPPAAYRWSLPTGVAPPPSPAGDPLTEAKVTLGRRLFYDADLSADGTMACGACHEQRHAFADGQKTRGGVTGEAGRRNVMSLANVGYYRALTWGDPGLTTLEGQVLVPLMGTHPVEMGMAGKGGALAERLGGDACYPRLFAAAFPEVQGRIGPDTVTRALAAFERTLVSMDSPYDRYRRGDRAALTVSAQRGMALFFGASLDCAACHAAPLFTDAGRGGADSFHNIGLYDLDGAGGYPANDHGLREITGRAGDEGRFRTPALRNVALNAPYMHDGSVATLSEAVRRHYDGGPRPLRDRRLAGAGVSDAQVDDLVAFLGALTDQAFVTDPKLALPKPDCPPLP